MAPPVFDRDLCLLQGVEDFVVEQFITQFAIEAFMNGAAPARNAALTTASAELSLANGLSLAATFEGEFSNVTRGYAGKGAIRYAW